MSIPRYQYTVRTMVTMVVEARDAQHAVDIAAISLGDMARTLVYDVRQDQAIGAEFEQRRPTTFEWTIPGADSPLPRKGASE